MIFFSVLRGNVFSKWSFLTRIQKVCCRNSDFEVYRCTVFLLFRNSRSVRRRDSYLVFLYINYLAIKYNISTLTNVKSVLSFLLFLLADTKKRIVMTRVIGEFRDSRFGLRDYQYGSKFFGFGNFITLHGLVCA